MKADLYTKAVLTIIAVCLVVITVSKIFPTQNATASGPVEVEIVGVSSSITWALPVEIESGPVEVEIAYGPVEVEIVEVSPSITSALPVSVDRY